MEKSTFVLKAGNRFEQILKTDFGDSKDKTIRSSIAISDGQLFIRTNSRLYCIGKQQI